MPGMFAMMIDTIAIISGVLRNIGAVEFCEYSAFAGCRNIAHNNMSAGMRKMQIVSTDSTYRTQIRSLLSKTSLDNN